MNGQTLTLDLSDLTVHRIEVSPATSLDSAPYGHGMNELAASCSDCGSFDPRPSFFLPEDWDWADA